MQILHDELKEVIDVWNLEPAVKEKLFRILDENPAKASHLFRYYHPEPGKGKVAELERAFAAKSGAKHALAVNSGTSALIAALVACGVGPGDEVIVPAYTFFASASAVVVARAIPVIAEIDETLTIDPADIERKITPQTKAILPVHMRGLPCDMDAIMKIAKKHKLRVIEDTAQAAGGTYKGKWLGTFGDAGCFSFDFYKIVASGEGGMVVADDETIYTRAQSWHDTAACWRPNRYARERMPGELFCGENYRLSEVHGAIALAQIRKLDGYLSRLRRNKKIFMEALPAMAGLRPAPVNDAAGDCATGMIFLADTPDRARKIVEAKAAGGIYDKTVRDWHVYRYWEHILQKKTVTAEGCPYTCPYYKGTLPAYGEEMCPRTLDIMSRMVGAGVSDAWSEDETRRAAADFARKVASC